MISIVICSADDAKFAGVASMYKRVLGAEAYEIIRIPDAKSMCEGYNWGLRHCRGEYIVFSHDDVEVLGPNFPAVLIGHLQRLDVIGVAGTDRLVGAAWTSSGPPHIFGQVASPSPPPATGWTVQIYGGVAARATDGIQALDGLFIAARREVAERVSFDEATFTGFHLYDIDFSFRAHLAGHRVAVVNDIPMIHQSRGRYDEDAWGRAAEAFKRKHAARLDGKALRPVRFEWTRVQVNTREEILRVMTPRWID